MKKKNLIITAAVVAIILSIILVKEVFIKKNSVQIEQTTTSEDIDYTKRYEQIKKSGKPSIIVFSYEGQCCPGTKRFLQMYNNSVLSIFDLFKDKIKSLFINTGSLSVEQKKDVVKIAKQIGARRLPSMVILDKTGKVYKSFLGRFNENDVKNIIKGLIN